MSIWLLASSVLWLYGLSVTKRGKVPAFHFIFGSVGLFFLLFFMSKPYTIWIMTQFVTKGVELLMDPFHFSRTLAEYGLTFIQMNPGQIALSIDYECSGVIETLAFFSLLTFFPVYTTREKIKWAVFGFFWIYFANVLRLAVIIVVVHFFGSTTFVFAHAILGRILFYVLVLFFYYRAFTYGHLAKK